MGFRISAPSRAPRQIAHRGSASGSFFRRRRRRGAATTGAAGCSVSFRISATAASMADGFGAAAAASSSESDSDSESASICAQTWPDGVRTTDDARRTEPSGARATASLVAVLTTSGAAVALA